MHLLIKFFIVYFKLTYESKSVQFGGELTPTELKDAPAVEWNFDPSSFYTIIMTGNNVLFYFPTTVIDCNKLFKKACIENTHSYIKDLSSKFLHFIAQEFPILDLRLKV